ncbi:MAG: hypothetical protein Q8M09_02615, partial [Pseudomonadota bacterium]|nr:hypothetical protein [Pseudomonadota bacterium]
MDLSVFSTAVQTALGSHLPGILGAIGILVVGYVLALVARAGTRKFRLPDPGRVMAVLSGNMNGTKHERFQVARMQAAHRRFKREPPFSKGGQGGLTQGRAATERPLNPPQPPFSKGGSQRAARLYRAT